MRIKFILTSVLLVAFTLSLSAQWNQKDADGKRTGKWKQYHVNGKMRYTGQFEKGNPVGTFVYYSSAGSILSKLIYSNNGASANAKLYYPDGKIKAEGMFLNKKKHGLWSYYHQRSGQKRAEESYKEGVNHGIWRVYFPDGKLSSEMNWKEGKRHGFYREYYNNGEPKVIASFFEGEYMGKYIAYHPHRIPMRTGDYVEGKMDGLWIYYNEKGKVKRKVLYDKGFVQKEEIFIKTIKTPTDSIGDPRKIGPPAGRY